MVPLSNTGAGLLPSRSSRKEKQPSLRISAEKNKALLMLEKTAAIAIRWA
jgi:hypothetical protein